MESKNNELAGIEVNLERLEKILASATKSLGSVNEITDKLNAISEMEQQFAELEHQFGELMPILESNMKNKKEIQNSLDTLSSLLSHEKVQDKIKRKFDSFSPEKKKSIRNQLNSISEAVNQRKT